MARASGARAAAGMSCAGGLMAAFVIGLGIGLGCGILWGKTEDGP